MASMSDINLKLKSTATSIHTSRSSYNKLNEGEAGVKQRRLKSARLIGEYEKPWIENSPYRKREIWDKVIFYGCIFFGFALGGVLCYFTYAAVPNHEYCLVFEDNFNDSANWRENWNLVQENGGFGVGSFDWTTDDPLNSYVDDNGLHIVPTLTLNTTNITVSQLLDRHTVNLTALGVCSSYNGSDCIVTSNATTHTIINPVRSARLTTQHKSTIAYGRVEVVAKMPVGDWLWPAIWLLPDVDMYGEWPKSGEFDIIETRGNNPKDYPAQSTRDTMISALHWGLDFKSDQFLRTTHKYTIRRSDYSKGFHTFGMEWSKDYVFFYVDSRLTQSLYVGFGSKAGDMWNRGAFEKKGYTADENPWAQGGGFNTPFDQPYYLILNVAVGGTAGFWPDGIGGKPWVDGTEQAALDFWETNSTWLSTWGEGDTRGMTVKSVKMWQEGACS